MRMLLAAIIISVMLLVSSATSLEARTGKTTAVILNQPPKSVYIGDQLKVTGQLIETNTGEGIANAEIKVIDNKPSGQVILVSIKTRKYGFFTSTWKMSLEDPRDKTVHLIVKYGGSENYIGSISREHTITVRLLPLEINFLYLKSSYKQGETPEIIFEVTSRRKLVEPDTVYASFNGQIVRPAVYGTGNYVYETVPLSKGHNQFFVNVSKVGYETVSRIITIRVN